MLYGSDSGSIYEYIGRAYFTGEKSLWSYYWDGDSLDTVPSGSYYLKAYLFDLAGNYLIETHDIMAYDYTQLQLLTDVLFGEVFAFNVSDLSNPHTITGVIENYFDGSSETLWDIIMEYYDPTVNRWVPLALNSTTIVANGDSADYEIVWDISRDRDFIASLYDREFRYEYLPLPVAYPSDSDIWGSWGTFGNSSLWQPLVLQEAGGAIDISIYNFDSHKLLLWIPTNFSNSISRSQ